MKKMVYEIKKRYPNAITLAIGDGANDTEMINCAHVGVGIAGVEGTAATNSADYAIGTFRHLHTLLFVHGFWSYHRISELVTFMFYKACLVSIIGYIFGFFSGMSGQQFFDDATYQIYNVIYTALPVIAIAVLDKKLPKYVLQNNPSAYKESKGVKFQKYIFISWIIRALLHAIIIFLPFIILEDDISPQGGYIRGLFTGSTLTYFSIILVPTFMVMYNMSTITIIHILAVFITSVASCFLFNWLLSLLPRFNPELYGVVEYMYQDPVSWIWLLWTVTTCLLTELVWRGGRNMLRPSFTTILKERVRLYGLDSKLNISDEDEYKWRNQIQKIKKVKTNTIEQSIQELRNIYNEEEEVKKNKESITLSNMRSAVIRSILRFRNVSGPIFNSAAKSKYQSHDPLKEYT